MSPAPHPSTASASKHGCFVGTGDLAFEALERWEQLPADALFVEVVGMATDSSDRLFVFNRGPHPLVVLDRDGRFITSWGDGLFARPHGITIGSDDSVYLTDDVDHTVRKFTPAGKLLLTLGTSGRPSDTGVIGHDYRTIQRIGPPFCLPTNLALSPSGDLYITDGYGNARVHKFSADGRLQFSWGEPGSGPGQFHVPHGIAVDRSGTVYVADRENSRVQLFSPDGEYLREWTGLARPCEIFIDERRSGPPLAYVAELGYRAGMWPGTSPPAPGATGGRVSILDLEGRLLTRWGGGGDPCVPGDFFAPHDIWVDSRGDVYVGEVTMSAGGNRGMVPPECHSLQKFRRIGRTEATP
ncbi:MAG TPA: peptidyl-alpha-hydroxyglycine alpha-amidating lyase family protein [Planctomycetota bacterium]|nr:peptidyl-alpha-hydroxyglycine alpha-amidating lyase family protein [Planctomycetota bacterium]